VDALSNLFGNAVVLSIWEERKLGASIEDLLVSGIGVPVRLQLVSATSKGTARAA
jgi:hypothetical protein